MFDDLCIFNEVINQLDIVAFSQKCVLYNYYIQIMFSSVYLWLYIHVGAVSSPKHISGCLT